MKKVIWGYTLIFLCFVGIVISTIVLGGIRNEYIIEATKWNQTTAKLVLLPINCLYIYFFSRLMVRISNKYRIKVNYIHLGFILVAFAILLEFIIGYFIENKTIDTLASEYNILRGNTWTLVLLMIFIFPYIIDRRKIVR